MSAEIGDPKLFCRPEIKAELEARNGVNQLDYITHLMEWQIEEIRPSHVRQLHALAIEEIYPCGGLYRNANMQVAIQDSDHKLPHESQVSSLVVDLLDYVNQQRINGTLALDRAAYVLWRLNWIHPFAGGNGRTARALAYLIVCIDNGKTLPGIPSMPRLIADKRDEYVRCLKAADAADLAGRIDLSEMSAFLRDVLTQQLESAINFSKLGLTVE